MEKVDLKTGEITPDMEISEGDENKNTAIEWYKNASMVQFDENAEKVLSEDINEEDLEIREDGIVYYPQVFYRDRLNKAFGRAQWTLIEKSHSIDEERHRFYLEGFLFVRGNFISKAIGETKYYPKDRGGDNKEDYSLATAYEAAKSDCITRCCKDLGIGNETFKPRFVADWKKKYAIRVYRNKKQKYGWRRKDQEMFYDEGPGNNEPDQERPSKPPANRNTKSQADGNNPPRQESQPAAAAGDASYLSDIAKFENVDDLIHYYLKIPEDIRRSSSSMIYKAYYAQRTQLEKAEMEKLGIKPIEKYERPLVLINKKSSPDELSGYDSLLMSEESVQIRQYYLAKYKQKLLFIGSDYEPAVIPF